MKSTNAIINFLILSLLTLLISCTSSTKIGDPAWTPIPEEDTEVDIVFSKRAYPNTLIQSMLFTKYNNPVEEIQIKGITSHPFDGPFLFKTNKTVIAVGLEKPRTATLNQIFQNTDAQNIKFHPLVNSNWPKYLEIAEQGELIGNEPFISSSNNDKITLTPDNIAKALTAFSQWEGVSYNPQDNSLKFLGTNQQHSPEISSSDLIAAYNAIFYHEAIGEPLFVDMDFAGSDKDYTVTFGGGFEDTRPGRILLNADLLLKALSSGIDPWTDVVPLTDEMCSQPQGSMQRLYCQYIKGSNRDNLDRIVRTYSQEMKNRSERTKLIITSTNPKDNKDCLDCLFRANKADQKLFKANIKDTGYYSCGYGKSPSYKISYKEFLKLLDSYSGDIKIDRNGIESMKLYQAYIDEIPREKTKCAVYNFFDEPDRDATLKRVEQIFNLTSYEKEIVISSYDRIEEEYQLIYSLLALGSKNIKRKLDANLTNSIRLFDVLLDIFGYELNELYTEGDYSFYDETWYKGMILFTYLLSEKESFYNDFVSLSKNDQITFAFIATYALADQDYIELIDKLQFYHPLCENNSFNNGGSVNNFSDAFARFTCRHLAKYDRTYLANLIRIQTPDIDYQTASEIKSEIDFEDRETGMQTTRFWFYPGNNVVTLDSIGYSTFLFNRPNMIAKAERLSRTGEDRRRGPYEAISLQEDRIPGIHENLDIVNKHYDKLSEVFPTLKELNNVVKILAFFRWLRDIQPDKFDLSAFERVVDYGTPTPRKYPIYQTVIALGDGSIVQAVGGVDLHSETQVELKDLSPLKEQLKTSNNIFYNSKNYKSSDLISETETINLKQQSYVNTESKSANYFYEKGAQKSFYSYKTKNQLSLFAKSIKNIFGEKEISLLQKSEDNQYLLDILNENSLIESWSISTQSEKVIAEPNKETSNFILDELIKNSVSRAIDINTPEKSILDFLSIFSDDVKLYKTGENYQLEVGVDNIYHAFKDTKNNKVLFQKETKTLLKSNTGNTYPNCFQLSITSKVPVQSIYRSNRGIVDDFEFDYRIFDLDKVVLEQLKSNTLDYKTPNIVVKSKNPVIQLKTTEIVKSPTDTLKSYEIANRPTLINLISKWQPNLVKENNSVLISRGIHPSIIRPSDAITKPTNRIFIADLEGLHNAHKGELQKMQNQYPTKLIILGEEEKDLKNIKEADEIIWITGLSEKQLRIKLSQYSQMEYFSGVKRLRIFNINNSIYDLGQNLFVENKQLQLVGAWSHILEFSTVKPLLEHLLVQRTNLELNEQLNQAIYQITNEYEKDLTPLKLRIIRYLPESLVFWEEVGTNNVWITNN